MPFAADAFSQENTPLVDTLKTFSRQPHVAFYAPGHKRGQGISLTLADLLGKAVFKADLPELPGLDNLLAPTGVIEKAQTLAAEAFGADQTWFLVNGSTCGVMAAILATCNPGDKIILPRNIHKSAIAGLILAGAMPIFLNPEYDQERDLVYSVTSEAVAKALNTHRDAKAVMVVYPTYEGVCGDLKAIAQITAQYNIPLLVDEAHGAHFAFHSDLPPAALSVGADLTVQSTHKVLGAMTQASMLHVKGTRVEPQRISKALELLQSSSPSYLLLASLDAARQQMALQGEELMSKTLSLARQARQQIAQISNLAVLEAPNQPRSGFYALDRTRLTVNVSKLGISGFAADEILHDQLGAIAELPTQQNLTFIVSLGNTSTDIKKLVKAFTQLAKDHQSLRLPISPSPHLPLSPSSISPREAFFAKSEIKPLLEAVGCISAELICPYPPGIPVLMPGEAIAPKAIDYLQQVLADGGIITGCSDPTLGTLKVVAG